MSIWRLVSGVFSIVLSIFVVFQSSIAGLSNALENNGEVSGSAGLIVAIFMLAGGIVSIATRKGGRGSSIALIIIFAFAALCGFTMAGSYADLTIWAGWCLINAILALVAFFKAKKKTKEM